MDAKWCIKRDYFVVVKGEEARGPLEMKDDGRINLTIFSEESWRRWLVREHNLQGIACLYLPQANVLCDRHDWRTEFQLDRKKLRFSALRKASSSFNRARIYWLSMQDIFFPLPNPRITLTKEDEEAMKGLNKVEAQKKSKKMIAHGLRTVLFALQLFESGHLTDLKCIVPIWTELLAEGDEEWLYFEKKYESRWKKLAEQFPEDCDPLPDPETEKMPSILHNLYFLVNLPPFQSSYKLGLEKELFHLVKLERQMNFALVGLSLNPTPQLDLLPPKPIKELISEYLDKYDVLPTMLESVQKFFSTMVSFLQHEYDELVEVVNHNIKITGTKFGREFAAVSKPHPHYTTLYALSRTEHHNAERYLITCPSTQFTIFENFMKTNPLPTEFKRIPNPAESSSS